MPYDGCPRRGHYNESSLKFGQKNNMQSLGGPKNHSGEHTELKKNVSRAFFLPGFRPMSNQVSSNASCKRTHGHEGMKIFTRGMKKMMSFAPPHCWRKRLDAFQAINIASLMLPEVCICSHGYSILHLLKIFWSLHLLTTLFGLAPA